MDPDIVLANIRETCQEARKVFNSVLYDNDTLEELVECFDALDGWLSNGGFLPKAWSEVSR